MIRKNILKIAFFMLFAISTTFSVKAQTLTAGDIAIIGVGVDDEEILLVALADIPSGESVFFTDDEWAGSDFNTGEGFYEWVTPAITAGNTITLTTTGSTAGGTVTQRAGSFALTNTGDGVFIYQTSTNVYNTGTYTILGFAGEDSGDSGSLTGTGLVEGTNAIYFGGDNGIYNDVRTANDKNGHLANIYDNSKWVTSGTAQTFDATNFVMTGAGPAIILGIVSGNTSEDEITTATFTAVLTVQPATDVVLNVSSGDLTEITLDVATLTFTDTTWDTPQTVTATGLDDLITDGNIEVTITVSVDDANSDDAYDAIADVTTTVTNEDNDLPNIIINEILASPGTSDTPGDNNFGDANGDGLRPNSSEDEFIEIVNLEPTSINIGGYTLSEDNGVVHTFAEPTNLPAGGSIVVFGGGTPTNIPGLAVTSSSGNLSLLNGGETVTLKNSGGTAISTVTYSSLTNQSFARNFDLTGDGVGHNSIESNSVNFSPGRYNTTNEPFSTNTWTGATNNDWSTASNWSLGSVPTGSDDVQIIKATNQPTTSGAVTVNSVTIASGATLIATNTFTGNVTYNRTLANGSQWYLMSSPVVGETFDAAWATANSIPNSSLNTSNIGIGYYDNTSLDTDDDGVGSDTATGHWSYLQSDDTNSANFNGVGKGYNIIRTGSGAITFIGNGIYTSSQTATITYGASNPNNYNLIGNPFTSYLNLSDFFTDNNTANLISGTAWFWNGSSYDAKMSSIPAEANFEIAPGQGFFIEAGTAAVGSDNLAFNINSTSHQGTDTFQKSNTSQYIYLNISDGSNNRYAKLYYIDGTNVGFDNGYDGKLFGGISHSFAIYSDLIESDGNKYQIQSLPNSDYENMIVPIGVIADAGKEITFTAEALNLPSGIKVFLEDKLTNTFTRLDEANSNYKVTLSENVDGIGRFYLHTKSSALSVDDVTMDGISIYKTTNSNLRITGLSQGKASLKLFNMLGKQVLADSFTSNGVQDITLPNLATGIYIVELTTENGSLNKKITLE